jgi:hypothetical protein
MRLIPMAGKKPTKPIDRLSLEGASVEDIMKALLRTPPPPVGHPSTRKQKPAKKAAKKR